VTDPEAYRYLAVVKLVPEYLFIEELRVMGIRPTDDLVIASGSGSNRVNRQAASTGSAFLTPTSWLTGVGDNRTYLVGNFEGGGLGDLLLPFLDVGDVWRNSVFLSSGVAFISNGDWLTTVGQGVRYQLGDFDGDGKSDILFPYLWQGSWRNDVSLSTGTAFQTNQNWLPANGQGADYHLGDFDGDSLDDTLMSYGDGQGTWHNVVCRSSGSQVSGFIDCRDWLSAVGVGAHYEIGDFNGDGKSDILFAYDWSGTWRNDVALSTGSAFAPNDLWLGGTDPQATYGVGDFDGDGRTDLLLRTGGTYQVCLSNKLDLGDQALGKKGGFAPCGTWLSTAIPTTVVTGSFDFR
jgi:hypothetical protein